MLIRKTAIYVDLISLVLLSNKQPNETGKRAFFALRAGSRSPCSHAKKTKSVDRLGFSGLDHARYVKYLYRIRWEAYLVPRSLIDGFFSKRSGYEISEKSA